MNLNLCVRFRRCWLPGHLVCTLVIVVAQVLVAEAQVGVGQPAPSQSQGATGLQGSPRSAQALLAGPGSLSAGVPGEHPLQPVLRWATDGLKNAEQISDYSATLVKRERIGGKLGGYEYIFCKIRHKPFSVYLYFLEPKELRGREVIYVEGRNDGKLRAHGVGWQKTFGTISLNPKGAFAMQGQLYPLTEIGLLTLVRRLVEIGERDSKFGECEVKYYKGAKINDRVCTCIEVIHPKPRQNFLFHIARVFVDDELNLVIRYASYDWPKAPGQPPPLLEEYSYLNLKLNNGFGDADFDERNPNYGFK